MKMCLTIFSWILASTLLGQNPVSPVGSDISGADASPINPFSAGYLTTAEMAKEIDVLGQQEPGRPVGVAALYTVEEGGAAPAAPATISIFDGPSPFADGVSASYGSADPAAIFGDLPRVGAAAPGAEAKLVPAALEGPDSARPLSDFPPGSISRIRVRLAAVFSGAGDPIPEPAGYPSFKVLYQNHLTHLQLKAGIQLPDDPTPDDIANGITNKIQDAVRTGQKISFDTAATMMLVMSYLQKQNNLKIGGEGYSDIVARGFAELNSALGGRKFCLSKRLSPIESFYLHKVQDQAKESIVTTRTVPSNIGRVEAIAQAFRQTDEIPSLPSVTPSWAYLINHLNRYLTVDDDGDINFESFTSDPIRRLSASKRDGQWRTDGIDAIVDELAAMMYATGHLHPEAFDVAMSLLKPREGKAVPANELQIRQDLFRMAAGLRDVDGKRLATIDGAGVASEGDVSDSFDIRDGAPAPANFSARTAVFLRDLKNPQLFSNEDLVGFLQAIHPNPIEGIKLVGTSMKYVFDQAVANIQPSRASEEIGSRRILLQDVLGAEYEVLSKTGHDVNIPGVDYDGFQVSSGDITRVNLIFQEIKATGTVNSERTTAIVGGADDPSSIAVMLRVEGRKALPGMGPQVQKLQGLAENVANAGVELDHFVWKFPVTDRSEILAIQRATHNRRTEDPGPIAEYAPSNPSEKPSEYSEAFLNVYYAQGEVQKTLGIVVGQAGEWNKAAPVYRVGDKYAVKNQGAAADSQGAYDHFVGGAYDAFGVNGQHMEDFESEAKLGAAVAGIAKRQPANPESRVFEYTGKKTGVEFESKRGRVEVTTVGDLSVPPKMSSEEDGEGGEPRDDGYDDGEGDGYDDGEGAIGGE